MDIMFFKQEGYIFFEVMAATVAIIRWKYISGSIWKYFPLFLLILALCETLANFFLQPQNSFLLYDFFVIPLEFLFYFWLFSKILLNKKLTIGGILLYIASFIIEFLLKDNPIGVTLFFPLSYTIGNIILLVFILFYFYQLINSEKLVIFYKEPMFWVSLGLLLFFLGTFPYYGMYNYLSKNHYDLFYNYTWGVIVLDYLMYTCFAISFLWQKKN